MPFLRNEDAALKQKLTGLVVHDATSGTGGRRVAARFRSPEYELADATYPLAIIEHTRVARDPEREMRGHIKVGYSPEGYPAWVDYADRAASPYYSESPIPLNIDYEVNFYTRKSQHLIELTAALMGFDRLSERFGYLEIPQDSTVRRLDVLGGPDFSESQDELGKRLFAATYVLRISSEYFWDDILTAPYTVREVFVDVLPPFYDQRPMQAQETL
ncbi:hypothetical protein [Streptomyces sp. CBMA29]|uniref:hypothetical protein n=1 Tax=Streptomyces sp. CBMA29 TaxID=1896314 RepID=UPI00166217F3|nr:hypothetical protein [Streptomyces sp. CBMA29]MBD0734062.1 hypothetical protein [Streptomyces sp. CBMA29]